MYKLFKCYNWMNNTNYIHGYVYSQTINLSTLEGMEIAFLQELVLYYAFISIVLGINCLYKWQIKGRLCKSNVICFFIFDVIARSTF